MSAIDRFEAELKREAAKPLTPPSVNVESVNLSGHYPHTVLAYIFTHPQRPGCRYGWAFPIWEPGAWNTPDHQAGEHEMFFGEYFGKSLEEFLDLPCSDSGLTWIGPPPANWDPR